MEKPAALQAGTQKVGWKIMISGGSESSTLRAILGAKIDFLACFFLKHKLYLILPMTMLKQRNVNFKGINLALKNLGRFSSPTASRAVLRDKYQHFDQYLKKTKLSSYNFV